MKAVSNKNIFSARVFAVLFLIAGFALLYYSTLSNSSVVAFIGLGLTLWGALFIFTRNGKYVDSKILDSTAKSAYSTFDRMINDLKLNGQAYYIPAYPDDAAVPEYLKKLKDPVAFISESPDGKPSVQELVEGRFLSQKSRGVFITSPGSELMAQMEKQLQSNFGKLSMEELTSVLPRCLTDMFNLAKSVDLTILANGDVSFKASGILYENLYLAQNALRSVGVLGCPVVSAVACAYAKSSSKTVVVKETVFSPSNHGVSVIFGFVKEE